MAHALFTDEVNREFGKLLKMNRELKKGEVDYINSWKALGLPWTDYDIERLGYLYRTSESYQAALDAMYEQRDKIINWLISNEVDEDVANLMVWTLAF